MGLWVLLFGFTLLGIFYFAIHWFNKNPHWQDRNVIYARKVLGKGFKVALNGIDWNQNQIPECIAFLPLKKLQKLAPHLQATHKIVVVENDSVLFKWETQDSIAFIPIVNSLQSHQIPMIFSHRLDSIHLENVYYLKFHQYYQITQE